MAKVSKRLFDDDSADQPATSTDASEPSDEARVQSDLLANATRMAEQYGSEDDPLPVDLLRALFEEPGSLTSDQLDAIESFFKEIIAQLSSDRSQADIVRLIPEGRTRQGELGVCKSVVHAVNQAKNMAEERSEDEQPSLAATATTVSAGTRPKRSQLRRDVQPNPLSARTPLRKKRGRTLQRSLQSDFDGVHTSAGATDTLTKPKAKKAKQAKLSFAAELEAGLQPLFVELRKVNAAGVQRDKKLDSRMLNIEQAVTALQRGHSNLIERLRANEGAVNELERKQRQTAPRHVTGIKRYAESPAEEGELSRELSDRDELSTELTDTGESTTGSGTPTSTLSSPLQPGIAPPRVNPLGLGKIEFPKFNIALGIDLFFSKVTRYFSLCRVDKSLWIDMVLQHLDAYSEWWDAHALTVPVHLASDWEYFVSTIKQFVSSGDKADAAMSKLLDCSQDDKSVDAYCTQFMKHLRDSRTSPDQPWLITHFLRNLSDPTLRRSASSDSGRRWRTVTDLVKHVKTLTVFDCKTKSRKRFGAAGKQDNQRNRHSDRERSAPGKHSGSRTNHPGRGDGRGGRPQASANAAHTSNNGGKKRRGGKQVKQRRAEHAHAAANAAIAGLDPATISSTVAAVLAAMQAQQTSGNAQH